MRIGLGRSENSVKRVERFEKKGKLKNFRKRVEKEEEKLKKIRRG